MFNNNFVFKILTLLRPNKIQSILRYLAHNLSTDSAYYKFLANYNFSHTQKNKYPCVYPHKLRTLIYMHLRYNGMA